jgi:hypothetical protein
MAASASPDFRGYGDGITPICIDWAPHRGTTLSSAPFAPHAQMRREGGQELNMPLLFWYLPFIIFSGAFEPAKHAPATDSHDDESRPRTA